MNLLGIIAEYNPLHLEVMGIPVIICRCAQALAQIGPLRGAFGPDDAVKEWQGTALCRGRAVPLP